MLSALFVNYNSWIVLRDALLSLRAAPPRLADGGVMPHEVIVVDNASPLRNPPLEAEIRALVAAIGGEYIAHDENGGYSKGMNLALARSRGEHVLVCNPDIVLMPECLTRLVAHLDAHPEIGAVVPEAFWDRQLEAKMPDGILPTPGESLANVLAILCKPFARAYTRRRTRRFVRLWTAPESVELEEFAGCLLLMRRALIDRIGFFDERFPLYFEDADLSLRVRKAGYKIVQLQSASFVHLYNRSGQTAHALAMERYWTSRRLYLRKWWGAYGVAVDRLCRALMRTRLYARRSLRPPEAVVDLPIIADKPVLLLPRTLRRFVVQHAMDINFLLAVGAFGSGDRWSPGNELFANYPAMIYLRVVDLDDPSGRAVGVWRFRRHA